MSVELHHCSLLVKTGFTLYGLLSFEDCVAVCVKFFIIKSQYEPEATLTQFNVINS